MHEWMTGFSLAEALPSVDSYLTGLVLMTGIYTQTQIHPLPSVPNIGQNTVEVGKISL